MPWEREPLVGQLERKFDSLGISGLLFDLDDTLLETTAYMKERKLALAIWAAGKLGLPLDLVMDELDEAAHEAYDVLHVSAERWVLAVQLTAIKLTGDSYALNEGIGLIQELFFDSPEIISGIHPVMNLFEQTGIKMAVVTHAPSTLPWSDWTWIKLQKTGLDRYFSQVWIADESKPKGIEDWRGAADLLQVPCENILGFGDNVNADGLPMLSLSMRVIMVEPKWRKSNGDLPAGIPVLASLVDAPEAILSLQR